MDLEHGIIATTAAALGGVVMKIIDVVYAHIKQNRTADRQDRESVEEGFRKLVENLQRDNELEREFIARLKEDHERVELENITLRGDNVILRSENRSLKRRIQQLERDRA